MDEWNQGFPSNFDVHNWMKAKVNLKWNRFRHIRSVLMRFAWLLPKQAIQRRQRTAWNVSSHIKEYIVGLEECMSLSLDFSRWTSLFSNVVNYIQYSKIKKTYAICYCMYGSIQCSRDRAIIIVAKEQWREDEERRKTANQRQTTLLMYLAMIIHFYDVEVFFSFGAERQYLQEFIEAPI